jgi:hypothetical protein
MSLKIWKKRFDLKKNDFYIKIKGKIFVKKIYNVKYFDYILKKFSVDRECLIIQNPNQYF